VTTMLKQLAQKWVERQAHLQHKGRKADACVLEFFVGASVALEATNHPEAEHVRAMIVLCLVSDPRPLRVVWRWASAPDASTAEASAA
jgi:hypothetical protein